MGNNKYFSLYRYGYVVIYRSRAQRQTQSHQPGKISFVENVENANTIHITQAWTTQSIT